MIPKIHLVAFADRTNHFIFVGVPNERGRYLRTDRSVALTSCPLCGAMVGEPCHDGHRRRYSGTTCHARRSKVRWSPEGWQDADDLIIETIPTSDEMMEPAA